MLVKSLLSSRAELKLPQIVSFGSTRLNVNKPTRLTFLFKRNTPRPVGVTQFRCNSTNSFSYSKNDKREDSDNIENHNEIDNDNSEDDSIFSTQHEVVTSEKKKRIFEELSCGDPEKIKKLNLIDFEINILRDQHYKIPSKLTRLNYEDLTHLNSLESRFRFLKFLFYKEKRRASNVRRKHEKREAKWKIMEERSSQGINTYKVGVTSMFIRIYDQALSKLLQQRQLAAQMFSQTVVFDCSYGPYMTRNKTKNCAQQLLLSYTCNVNHISPFSVKVCNYDKKSLFGQCLHSLVPNFNEDNHPWDFHSESFLDLYDRDRIVYLSPHVKHEIKEWNHNDVYVIGAFVDKGYNVPASKVKIQQAKLRAGRLPLDSFVNWKMGDKSLPINIVLKILLDMRHYESWTIALKNVPLRKVWNI